MINLRWRSDTNQHICEIQLVHRQLLTARKGLPGHAVYNRVRNANELLHLQGMQPQTSDELQQWLLWWHTNGKHPSYDPASSDVLEQHPNTWNTSKITDMSRLFSRAELYDFNEPIGNWDVSHVNDMSQMFSGHRAVSGTSGISCPHAFNQDISRWDTSSVCSMSGMFFYAENFNQPLEEWDTSSVTRMDSMFERATNFNQPLGKWDTSRVATMASMFAKAYDFNQPLEGWDVGRVTLMSKMFASTKHFDQPLNGWNVSTVTSMREMFRHAAVFNQDIAMWNTSSVRNFFRMFNNAKMFNKDISSWDTSSASAAAASQGIVECSAIRTQPHEWANMFGGAESMSQPTPVFTEGSGCVVM